MIQKCFNSIAFAYTILMAALLLIVVSKHQGERRAKSSQRTIYTPSESGLLVPRNAATSTPV